LKRVVALRVHLDDSTADNGPLRESLDLMAWVSYERTKSPVSLKPQNLRPLIIHSSGKIADARPRRVLHVEYCDSLTLDEGLEIARA
jgi:hypothetical protein